MLALFTAWTGLHYIPPIGRPRGTRYPLLARAASVSRLSTLPDLTRGSLPARFADATLVYPRGLASLGAGATDRPRGLLYPLPVMSLSVCHAVREQPFPTYLVQVGIPMLTNSPERPFGSMGQMLLARVLPEC